ncbi:MAG: hypothetical protein AAFX95_11200 [Cyanobacteria bacterium J06639_16]
MVGNNRLFTAVISASIFGSLSLSPIQAFARPQSSNGFFNSQDILAWDDGLMTKASAESELFSDELQSSEKSTEQECRAAFTEAVNTIENGRRVEVVDIVSIDLSRGHRGYPANAPVGIILAMEGQATADVLNSHQFMNNISSQIIEDCQPVSLVEFQMYSTDWAETYGLVNGNVVLFSCIEAGIGANPRWGQVVCL